MDTSPLSRFASTYSFELDDYQLQGCHHLDEGAGVLIAAPTGAGKTVVGEYATFLALESGLKCFYTTPIKALSNQKYHDLVARYGVDSVGLLTGDASVNSEAPIVVMTTEVLRNMIYAGSSTLVGLGWVVMDEVHYLADRFRGPVWEEVILGLDPTVRLVALSATVSNAEEFGEWLDEVRGDVRVVVSEERPVPLSQHVAVRGGLIDLFDPRGDDVNPELTRLAKQESRYHRDDARRPRGRSGRGRKTVSYGSGRFGGASMPRNRRGNTDRGHARNGGQGKDRGRGQWGRGQDRERAPRNSPSRGQVVRALRRSRLLPAIIFIFSRKGCEAAVHQLATQDIVLTSEYEAGQIRQIAESYGDSLGVEERRALGWDTFVSHLERGLAAHHAGLLPVQKAVVEEAFVRGLLKVVVATETLALGINMPARTVVLEKLVKYNGQTHADITAGEYTQLTGRAGRRGIDTQGHAVVCWQPGMDPRAVAGLASRRTYPLRSAFEPTYNMAVNLVHSMGREQAVDLLVHSFAQFQTDRRIGARAGLGREDEQAISDYLAAAHCELGDFTEYAAMREKVSQLEAEQARARRGGARAEILDSVRELGVGDVIAVPSGSHAGWAVVLDAGRRGGRTASIRVMAMVEGHTVVTLGNDDIDAPVHRMAGIHVPKHFHPGNAAARRALGRDLDAATARLEPPRPDRRYKARPDTDLADEIARLRAAIRTHPCHQCPDRETHARFAERAMRLQRARDKAQAKARRRTTSIATRFDRICLVLEALGYLADDGHQVTDRGRMLSRIYSELDLVTCEAIGEGVFDELDPADLAAVLSTLVHESRPGDRGRMMRMPTHESERAESRLRAVRARVGRLERDQRLEPRRDLDIGFAETIHAWVCGAGLDVVLSEGGSAGDFVRQARQVADLAGQISRAGVDDELAHTCRQVVGAIQRGVVVLDRDEG